MRRKTFEIYFRETSIHEGFEILAQAKEDRLLRGKKVSAPSGYEIFRKEYKSGKALQCSCCGLTASCFVASKHQNDFEEKSPVLNLYAYAGTSLVLMTRDHIIPKSLGGSDDVRNLRIQCGPCNSNRGNLMSSDDIQFMLDNPHLIKKQND